jgi:hypothetical protein
VSLLLSRRDLLFTLASGTAGFGAAVSGARGWGLLQAYLDQEDAWEEATRPNDEFIARHAANLQRLSFGTSFAAEMWHDDARGRRDALWGLGFALRDLGIHRVRLGIRWRSTVEKDGSINLSSIRPVLDRCLAAGADVCLNVGAIRTFRYPEEYVPPAVFSSLKQPPPPRSVIHPSNELAGHALDYLKRLLDALEGEYGRGIPLIRSVQVENEPFHELGHNQWIMSPAYLATQMRMLDEVMPGVQVLMNSAGRRNLESIRRTCAAVIAADPSWRGRLVSGFDFYFRSPDRARSTLGRYFDPITYGGAFSASCESQIEAARDLGFRIEVTEGQAEPFGVYDSPGNSVTDFRYLVIRCLDKVFDRRQPALLRIWGIEELAKKAQHGLLNDEHRQIISLIQAVNSVPQESTGLPT